MTLSYEEMRALEITHVCGECDAPLVIRWCPWSSRWKERRSELWKPGNAISVARKDLTIRFQ